MSINYFSPIILLAFFLSVSVIVRGNVINLRNFVFASHPSTSLGFLHRNSSFTNLYDMFLNAVQNCTATYYELIMHHIQESKSPYEALESRVKKQLRDYSKSITADEKELEKQVKETTHKDIDSLVKIAHRYMQLNPLEYWDYLCKFLLYIFNYFYANVAIHMLYLLTPYHINMAFSGHEDDMMVWRLKKSLTSNPDDDKWPCIKSTTTLNIPQEKLYKLIMDSSKIHLFNKHSLGRNDIDILNHHTKIVWARSKIPFVSKPFDFCTLM